MKKFIAILKFLFFVFFIQVGFAHGAENIFNEKNGVVYIGGATNNYIFNKNKTDLVHKIYNIDVRQNERQLLLERSEGIYSFALGRSYIAAISKTGSHVNLNSRLLLYAMDGSLKKVIQNVGSDGDGYIAWEPNGTKLAYVTGKIGEDEHFHPNGIWIYDVEKDEAKKIADGGYESPYRLVWSAHDNNIYMQESEADTSRVSVYNTNKGQLADSQFKGLIFSDDGKYYISSEERPPYQMAFILNDSATGKVVYRFEIGQYDPYFDWLGNGKFLKNSHLLLIWGGTAKGKYKVFDVDKKSYIRESKGALIGWNKDMTKLVVYDGGGKQIHIEETISGKRLKSLDIPLP